MNHELVTEKIEYQGIIDRHSKQSRSSFLSMIEEMVDMIDIPSQYSDVEYFLEINDDGYSECSDEIVITAYGTRAETKGEINKESEWTEKSKAQRKTEYEKLKKEFGE